MISNHYYQVCPSGKHLKALKLLLIIHCEQQSVQLFSPMFFFYLDNKGALSLSLFPATDAVIFHWDLSTRLLIAQERICCVVLIPFLDTYGGTYDSVIMCLPKDSKDFTL